MTLYEVNLTVDDAIAAEYERWLDAHIDEILRLPGFLSAERFSREPSEAEPHDPSTRYWTVHYRLKDRASLDRYFREDAARLRADATARFAGRFTASRRVLVPVSD